MQAHIQLESENRTLVGKFLLNLDNNENFPTSFNTLLLYQKLSKYMLAPLKEAGYKKMRSLCSIDVGHDNAQKSLPCISKSPAPVVGFTN